MLMGDRISSRRRDSDSRDAAAGELHSESSPAVQYDVDLMALARLLVNRRRWIIGTVCVTLLATAGIMFSRPNLYTSRATILPSGESDSLASLKAVVGIGGGMDATDENSSALFPLILRSDLVNEAGVAEE